MSHLWDIVQAHHRDFGPSYSEIARRMGVGVQTLFNWRDRAIKEVPTERVLRALSEVTRTPLSRVLGAALLDAGWPPDVVREAGYDLPGDPVTEPSPTHGQTG